MEKDPDELLQYDATIVDKLYYKEICHGAKDSGFNTRRIMFLEFSQYLEKYLWPNYDENASHAHLMSIVCLVNEKFREKVEVWKVDFLFHTCFMSLNLN